MVKVARIIGMALLTMVLSGCGSLRGTSTAPPAVDDGQEEPDKEAHKTQVIHSHQQTLSLSQLLLQRQELCRMPAKDRDRLVKDYHWVFVAGDTELDDLQTLLPKRRHQLNALMLATCDPAKTNNDLSEMLAVVTAEEDWPEDYVAFFDLLVATQQARSILRDGHDKLLEKYQRLQQDYQNLQEDYQRLQVEHENTIKGISEIERGIDVPDADNFHP